MFILLLFFSSDSEKANSLTETVPAKKNNNVYLTLPDAHDNDSGKRNKESNGWLKSNVNNHI